jgi:hypothetical protein
LDVFKALVAHCSLSAAAVHIEFLANDRDKAVGLAFIAAGTWVF